MLYSQKRWIKYMHKSHCQTYSLKNHSKLLDSYCSIELRTFKKNSSDDLYLLVTDAFYICQQMLAIAIFFLFQTTNTRAQESMQAVFEIVNNSILFDETPFSERTSESLTSCSRQCTRDKRCKSANFIKSEEMCSLTKKTRRTHPLLFQRQDNTIHLLKVWQIIRE